jgi:putative hydrolase of the HAD superfamily
VERAEHRRYAPGIADRQSEPRPEAGENMTKNKSAITCMFVDIGGVLLTNGWDRHARRRAVAKFKLNWTEMEERHRLTFEIHEEGKLNFEEYLNLVVFYEKRPFTRTLYVRAIEAVRGHDRDGSSTEGSARFEDRRCQQRIARTERVSDSHVQAGRFVDSFISSCFVHLRKPDANIFRLALDITQTPAHQVLYIENAPMFVQIAQGLGIRSILHTDSKSTRAQLASLGLEDRDRE